MQKPQEWETTEAKSFGEFETIEPGGYICKILKAEEQLSKSGKNMLVLFWDIASGEHTDFYKRDFERRKESNAEAKWNAVYYQLTEGNSTSYFKGLITSLEESNPGYKWNFDEKTLKGKMFGGAIGLEEWDNGEKSGMQAKLRYVTSVETIKKGITAPKDKMLEKKVAADYGLGEDFSLMEDDDCPF